LAAQSDEVIDKIQKLLDLTREIIKERAVVGLWLAVYAFHGHYLKGGGQLSVRSGQFAWQS